jgi:hypothetical protein
MTIPDPKLTNWVRKQLVNDLTEEGVITRIELLHAADGMNAERLVTVPVGDEADHDAIATELWEAAENDSGTRTSALPQRYVAASFRASGDGVNSQYAFIFRGGNQRSKQLNLADTFPPTEQGERGLVMHQTSRMHQLMFDMAERFSDRAAQDLQRERALRIKLEENYMKHLEVLEDLHDRKHQRDLEVARETSKAKRHEEIMRLAMKMLPMLLSQVAPGLAGKSVARDMGIQQVLKGLTQEEVMGVLSALSDSNKEAFFQLYSNYAKETNKEEEELHPLLRSESN